MLHKDYHYSTNNFPTTITKTICFKMCMNQPYRGYFKSSEGEKEQDFCWAL